MKYCRVIERNCGRLAEWIFRLRTLPLSLSVDVMMLMMLPWQLYRSGHAIAKVNHHRRMSSVNFRGAPCTTFLPEKYVWKINKIPEFYMIFARKVSEFYGIIARKIFSLFFVGEGHVPPLPSPSPSPMPTIIIGWEIYTKTLFMHEECGVSWIFLHPLSIARTVAPRSSGGKLQYIILHAAWWWRRP